MSNSAITGPILSDVRRSPSGSAAAPSWSFADATGTGVYLASTDVLALSTAGVQRVVVDAAGNVGIGTASPSSDHALDIRRSNSLVAISLGASGATAGVDNFELQHGASKEAYIWNRANSYISFGTNNTERMLLDANGRLLVGTTSNPDNNQLHIKQTGPYSTIGVIAGTSGAFLNWYNNSNGYLASVYHTGATVVYATSSSDHRLKKDIAPLEKGLEKVCSMKPVSFTWKESGEKDIGFIAHELQTVIPEAISGQKDAVDADGNPKYQTIFPAPAQMVASLVAAIQELKAELDEAKAKIAALEAK